MRASSIVKLPLSVSQEFCERFYRLQKIKKVGFSPCSNHTGGWSPYSSLTIAWNGLTS
jgi:hypothetical protein